jgi:Tol biopolymer transport system component
MRMVRVRTVLLCLAAAAVSGIGAANASAAYPGANGKIAFVSGTPGSYDIYTMNSDGSGRIQLTSASGDDVDPVWSPDGSKIAFASDRDGELSIYVMGGDGSNVTRVTTTPLAFSPTWSPDGTKLAFEGIRPLQSANNADIWIVNEDGSGLTNVTQSDDSWEEYPAWSPDGSRIAFDADDGADTEIFVMNVDGSNRLQLTNNFNAFRPPGDYLPAWSSDGSKIAFVSERDTILDPFTSAISPELYTMNADGSGQTRLTTNAFFDNEPAWSPDGSAIVLTSDEGDEGGLGEIVRIAVDGTGRTNLTQTPAVDDLGPDWQPAASIPAYDFAGFFAPVDNQPTLNKVNAGKAIPVKFSLTGDQGLDIFAAGYPQSAPIDCSSLAEIDLIEETVAAGSSSLTYHPETDRYHYVWKTDALWAGTCRRLVIGLADGTFHRADFKF